MVVAGSTRQTRVAGMRPRDTEGGVMRARTRYIVPLALAALVTTACGESGSSGTGGGADSCAHNLASSPSRSNGTRPVSA